MKAHDDRPSFAEVPFPIGADDVERRTWEVFASELHKCVGFEALSETDINQIVLAGLGYRTFNEIESQDIATVTLPDYDAELRDGVSWRLYLTGRIGLATASAALARAYRATPFAVKRRYSREGMLFKKDRNQWEYGSSARKLRFVEKIKTEIFESRKFEAGRIYDRDRFRNQCFLACQYWHQSSGKTVKQMQLEFESDAWLSVRDTVHTYKDNALPPGFSVISYYGNDGAPLGLGIVCEAINAYLQEIYPLDGRALLGAIESLWLSTTAPAGAWVPDGVISTGPYTAPYDQRRTVAGTDDASSSEPPGIFEAEARLEQRLVGGIDEADVPYDDVESLRVENSRLVLQRRVSLRNNNWAQRVTEFKKQDLQGILGIDIERSCDPAWWTETVPWTMTAETAQTIIDVFSTVGRLSELEEKALAAEANLVEEYAALVDAMAGQFRPTISREAVNPSKVFHSCPWHPEQMRQLYPELSKFPDADLYDLQFSFWHKDDIDYGMFMDGKKTPLFLAYCVATLSGLELFLADTRKWLYISRLLRLQARDVTPLNGSQFKRVTGQALRLYQQVQAMERFVDSLDILSDSFWPRTFEEREGPSQT